MMKKDKMISLLKDKIYQVHGVHNTAINVNNGILNERLLRRERKLFLQSTMSDLADNLVTKRQGYPQNDLSDVEFETDFVIMKRDDFNEVLKYIGNE